MAHLPTADQPAPAAPPAPREPEFDLAVDAAVFVASRALEGDMAAVRRLADGLDLTEVRALEAALEDALVTVRNSRIRARRAAEDGEV